MAFLPYINDYVHVPVPMLLSVHLQVWGLYFHSISMSMTEENFFYFKNMHNMLFWVQNLVVWNIQQFNNLSLRFWLKTKPFFWS